MEEPWHEVLKPREAVIPDIVGLVIVWTPLYYASHVGYVFWGYIRHEAACYENC